MIWPPLMWRMEHLAEMMAKDTEIDSLRLHLNNANATIERLDTERLAEWERQSKVSQKELVDSVKPQPKKPSGHKSRSGFRAKAKAHSESTRPAPNDSAKSLEIRVKREGGKV